MIEILICLAIATAILAVIVGGGVAFFYALNRYGAIVFQIFFAILLVLTTTGIVYSARNPIRAPQSQPTIKEQP